MWKWFKKAPKPEEHVHTWGNWVEKHRGEIYNTSLVYDPERRQRHTGFFIYQERQCSSCKLIEAKNTKTSVVS